MNAQKQSSNTHESVFNDVNGFISFVQLNPNMSRPTKAFIWELVQEDNQLAIDLVQEYHESSYDYTPDKIKDAFNRLIRLGYKEDRFDMTLIIPIKSKPFHSPGFEGMDTITT